MVIRAGNGDVVVAVDEVFHHREGDARPTRNAQPVDPPVHAIDIVVQLPMPRMAGRRRVFLDPVARRDDAAAGFDAARAAVGDLFVLGRPRQDQDAVAANDLRVGVDVGRFDDEVERHAVGNQELRRQRTVGTSLRRNVDRIARQ
jgi:hypothetical protein